MRPTVNGRALTIQKLIILQAVGTTKMVIWQVRFHVRLPCFFSVKTPDFESGRANITPAMVSPIVASLPLLPDNSHQFLPATRGHF